MAYRIAICDDSKNDSEYVSRLLNIWARQRQISVNCDCFSSAESFLFHYSEDKGYDILLLDIEMGTMDGVTMAKQIRHDNDTVQIIFITGYSDYISEGYEVSALHYLMKPIDEKKLFSVLDRAVLKLEFCERVLNISMSGVTVRLALRDIIYFDVFKNYVTVHLKHGEEYKVKKTLSEFEKLLDERFLRVGRAMIVNLDCISKVTKTDVYLSCNIKLPLPKGAYEILNRAIINCIK